MVNLRWWWWWWWWWWRRKKKVTVWRKGSAWGLSMTMLRIDYQIRCIWKRFPCSPNGMGGWGPAPFQAQKKTNESISKKSYQILRCPVRLQSPSSHRLKQLLVSSLEATIIYNPWVWTWPNPVGSDFPVTTVWVTPHRILKKPASKRRRSLERASFATFWALYGLISGEQKGDKKTTSSNHNLKYIIFI